MQWANPRIAVFDKTHGKLLSGPIGATTLWKNFPAPCSSGGLGNGTVEYDKIAARFIVSRHATDNNGKWYQCVAVSTTSDATGSYYLYGFQLPGTDFPDYPKLSVWPDAYYFTSDDLNPSTFAYDQVLVCAFDRKKMLTGAAATAHCFQLPSSTYGHSFLSSDFDGTVLPPTGSPAFFMNLGTNALRLWKFHVDFTTPSKTTFTGPTNIPVASFSLPCSTGGLCVHQLGTTQRLDSVGERLMYRLAYRNFSGQLITLMVTHTIAQPYPRNATLRWYEIANPGGTPSVLQSGTYAPDGNSRWLGSIAMDKMKNIGIGYSISSANMYAAIAFTGRVPGEPVGTLEAETTIWSGGGANTQMGYNWGSYSALSVDPVNDCTFWYTNEYIPVTGQRNWHTRIASFKFANCQ